MKVDPVLLFCSSITGSRGRLKRIYTNGHMGAGGSSGQRLKALQWSSRQWGNEGATTNGII